MRRKKKLVAKCYQPGWEYVPAVETDIRKTFARARREMKEQARKPEPGKLSVIKREKAA